MGERELVWEVPTMGILGEGWQRVTLPKEGLRRVGGWAGFSGQRQEPRPSFSKHQQSHTESSPRMTLHIGEKGHSTWQGRGEMGLEEAVCWRREAWSLVPRPDLMDASSFLNCRMGNLSPSLDLRRPSCCMGGDGEPGWSRKSPGIQTSLAGSTLLSLCQQFQVCGSLRKSLSSLLEECH